MRFLIDNALSPLVAQKLQEAGHNAVHVRDYSMQKASDDEILGRAVDESRIVVSADTDFGTLLAFRQEREPSFILFRRGVDRLPELQAQLLLSNLPTLERDLMEGSIVVFDQNHLRIRSLPIGR